jgi:HK97 gp10 family phage protein
VITSWKVDDKELAAALRQSSVGDFLRAKAEEGVHAARDLAPVRTGRYRDSFHVVTPRVQGDLLVGGFGTSAWYWHFVEFGTWHTRAHRVLSRAGEQISSRVEVA